MSIQAVHWALSQWIENPGAKLVLVAVANYADHKSGEGWPSLAALIDETCLPRRTIQRHVAALVELGLLVKAQRFEDSGRQTSNLYRIDTSVTVRRPAGASDEAGEGAETTLPEREGGCQIGTPEGVTGGTGEGVTGDTLYENHQKEPSQEPIPPTPPRGAERVRARDGQGRRSAVDDLSAEEVASFDRWFAAWPDAHVHRRETALREWGRLSEADRALAVEATARFLHDQARSGKLRKYAPSTFLGDGIFRRVPRAAASKPSVREVADVVPWSREGWWFVHLWARQPYGSTARQRLSEMLGGWPSGRTFRVFRDELPTVQQLEAMVSIPADGDDARAWREHYFPPGLAVPEWRRHVDLPKPRGGGWMFVPARRPEEVVA